MAKTTVIGLFQSHANAAATIDDLENAGLGRSDIKLLSGTDLDADDVKRKGAPGGLKGFMAKVGLSDDVGITDEDASFYAGQLQSGKALLVAHCDDDEIGPCSSIMERHGAMADDASKAGRPGLAETSAPASRSMQSGTSTQSGSIPVVKEDVNIGKQQISKGGVRVFSRPIEHRVEKDIPLREEHARVERRAVDRPATAADFQTQSKSLEVTETAEQPLISKQARVVEEVSLGKEVTEKSQRVAATARGTEVDVQNLGSSVGRYEDFDSDFRNNFQSNYGASGVDYSSYSPAYRYGYDLATHENYRHHKDWSSLEGDARSSWEAKNPGTWDKFKDAIRYSWQRTRGMGPMRTSRPSAGQPLTRDSVPHH